MSSLSLLVLLLFTVSSHACTARPLTIKPSANCHFHQEVEKDKDKVKLLETITTTSSNLKGKQVVYDSCSSTSSTWKQMVVVDGPSGASFQKDSPSSLAIKERREVKESDEIYGCVLCRRRGGMNRHAQCWDLQATILRRQRRKKPLLRWITPNPIANHPFIMTSLDT
ncbi:uncharacterized protein LOC130954407 isoform X1 [Arachis stenosperma]|uniref:uncharacterized protein LOC130954407 isoform X1 n=1 Tax=Arachis stenosperma TaxID=217475 RepID=UPI0025AC2C8B|nr:uncharacterized protein LOC130954407 isoform X1 [Arachis stenosperma]